MHQYDISSAGLEGVIALIGKLWSCVALTLCVTGSCAWLSQRFHLNLLVVPSTVAPKPCSWYWVSFHESWNYLPNGRMAHCFLCLWWECWLESRRVTAVWLHQSWIPLEWVSLSLFRAVSLSRSLSSLSFSSLSKNQHVQMVDLGRRVLCLNKLTWAWLGCLSCERASEYIDLCLIKNGRPGIWYHDRRILL